MSSSGFVVGFRHIILGLDIGGIDWLDIVLGGGGCRRLPRQQSSAKVLEVGRRAWPSRQLLEHRISDISRATCSDRRSTHGTPHR